MRNDEPTWEDTRGGVENWVDNALAIPLFAFAGGLLDRDLSLLAVALMAWAVFVVIWTPWIIFRVQMNRPTGDTPRATAMLGIGLLPWIGVLAFVDWLDNWIALAIAFAAVFVWGATALALAALQRPRPKSAGQRGVILTAGGISYGAVALSFLGMLLAGLVELPGFVLFVCLLVGGFSAVACISVLSAAGRPVPPVEPGQP